jgi:predicted oxidoreductase
MQSVKLGKSKLESSALAYGCMRIPGTWDPSEVTDANREAAYKAVHAAFEAGYTLFDTADLYCQGVAEELLGDVLADTNGMRDRIVIATKCGVRRGGDPNPDSPPRYDFSAKHIIESCEASLNRMRVESIDLYMLHRPDFLAAPEEVATAFQQLEVTGKVRHFGVSNFRPSLVRALQKYCPMPLIVNQIELHAGFLDPLEDGTLDLCMEKKMTPLAWSSLNRGIFGTGAPVPDDHPKADVLRETCRVMDEIGQKYDVGRDVIALAWLMKHPSKPIPIVGSTNPERIKAAAEAAYLEISRDDWYRILIAARGKPLP